MEIQLRCRIYLTTQWVRSRRASSLKGCLVDPIDQAGGEVERRKIPILEVVLRVGEVSEAETQMPGHVIVDATRDRPLSAGTFDWLRIFLPHNWRIQVPPPIPTASKNGYVGSKGAVMQRESRAAKGRLLMLGIEPPLNSTPELKAEQVLCLQE